jgi:hypothetical protein
MPQVFKKLTTVIIWILFITGCLSILTSLWGIWNGRNGLNWQVLAIGVASLFLSVITIKYKKTME